ncbi:related to transport protein USO1 [Sporisorium reilianum f. sp. reilianum]|uniref:Related to transport protein USO1 n=1 Tax=Sporisorium reilianum f. sp. reilianum TaxID=72559 RepID=A0A2N8ULG6_9BASI|nr:related to transport protein USO1 [Sporisorium reilianum f. sp. reilianum]
MEGRTLNVAAPVFQPAALATSKADTITPAQTPGQAVRPTMLSQIQNQMTPVGGMPGATTHLNANSRPFVPGGGAANPSIFKPHTPVTPYHPPPPLLTNPSRSPLPSHRLGHGMNNASVQLTGLPAFLATPPTIHHMPHPSGYVGPPSPISPNASGPPSPFFMPSGHVSLGMPHPGAAMAANMKFRKGKGLPPVTPLKTTGHNSTPSISMNPAAFAASLAALKAKKKIVVALPAEQPLPDDGAMLAQPEPELVEDVADGEAEDTHQPAKTSKADAARRSRARAAASTRSRWIQRQPWSSDQHVLVPCIELPKDATVTREIHPDPWPHSLGLPDTIEIYLPGMSAWDEYLEMRYEEQQMEAQAAHSDVDAAMLHHPALLPPNTAAFNADHRGRSFSISTPADPSMVTFKLNRFLQSQQQQLQQDPNQPIGRDTPTKSNNPSEPFGRFQTDLPDRLREAFARRLGDNAEPQLRPPLKHSHTMSLGLPSSGGPFGPEVFSALDMIRANSDGGPSKPPSEAQDLPEKPSSDSEALFGRQEIHLSNIVEEEAERESEAERAHVRHNATKGTSSGNWQDLGRGFGYEPEKRTAQNGSSRKHARQASRISVSTSNRGGEEGEQLLDDDDQDVEIRTNPSEDADASDFEEELHEYGPDHWRARHGSVHLSAFGDAHGRYGYDDMSQESEDDTLRDSLTPSDEQFSNPSDEEAAREERILRRQHRAAERAARQERNQRRRGRTNTNNTLPSSSIGEAELHEHGSYGPNRNELRRGSRHGDIISNPSDEVQSDLDDSMTFGHNEKLYVDEQGQRFSQDFRFPALKLPFAPNNAQARPSRASDGRPPLSGTLGRASGISLLNPDAKEFEFGGASAAARSVSAPMPSQHNEAEAAQGQHFRLPSIKTSSFGSLADAPHLNVEAAPFKPGAFTFKTSQRLQVPETSRSASPSIAVAGVDGDVHDRDAENREVQGREKRTRYGPIDYESEDDVRYPTYSTSPPRPQASAASIEGPLRSFSTLARQGPPPFLPPGYSQPQQRAVSHESRFTADAPSFVPTWAKGNQQFGGSTSFKRPSLPDWGHQAGQGQGDGGQAARPSIFDPTFFTRETGSKAIPIKPPPGVDRSDSAAQQARQAASSLSTSVSVDSLQGNAGQTSTETLKPPAAWQKPISPRSAERTQPMHIPVGPHSSQSSSASLASDVGFPASIRWGGHRARSSISMSSVERRMRKSQHGHYDSRGDSGNGDYQDEDDEESLSDFVEEIVDRVDKALEGWAGKILDEVTIMGQVRPHPRNVAAAAAEFAIDQDKLVEEMLRRMEEALDVHLASSFSLHARKATGASDETQTTIRPSQPKHASSDDKMTSLGLVDAPGEWDFDYVQEMLDVKLGDFRKQIEASMAQIMDKLEAPGLISPGAKHVANGEAANGTGLPSDFAESITARLLAQVQTLFERYTSSSREVQSASAAKLQQAMQSKLDENLVLLSEKGAADRSSIQLMLESEMHELERSISEVGKSVKDRLQSALEVSLPSLLENKAASDASLADRLTNKLGQALGPVLSEERRCLLEEHQTSRDLLLEAVPSSSQIAQSTVELIEPLVKSLKSDPIDSDALVSRLAEVIGKQSIEHMVDLNPVLALLEPLIVKHEEARAFSKKILQRQEDTERTLSELPGAINAKTEIFLSSASDASEKQGLVLEKIAEIKAQLRREADASSSAASIDTADLHKRLEDLAKDRALTQETAEKTLAELAGVYQVLDSSYQALSRLEAQHTSSEQSHRELTAKLEKQAQAGADLARELREAEGRAARAEAAQAEVAARLASSDRESAMLRDQLAQMTAELAASKAERAQEREASAKALAEAVARADRAETASVETQDRMGRLLEQATVSEREAYESAKSVLERASKAEGQLAALEKRAAEQDNKIANLQQVSATQKQKAAQSHQKLAEGEKRVKELEAKAEQLTAATVRLGVLEVKASELDDTRRQLQQSEEREAHATEQLRRCDERFQQLERDLVEMKDVFVERSVHEAVEKRLAESQKLVQQLQAKLAAAAAASRTSDGWEAVEQPGTGAWASMHAPRIHVEEEQSDESAESAARSTRSVSFASTAGSHGKREVEVDEGGWWS